MSKLITGGCLCGAVTYKSDAEPVITSHCHCVDCRKSSGTGHCTHAGVPKAALHVDGKVQFYERPADSGNIISRGFCRNCGSAVYSTNSSMTDLVFIRASSLDNPEIVTPTLVVYTSRAASWDHMDPNLPSFTEMPEGGPEKVIADAM